MSALKNASQPIIIVGGGLGGLAAALALAARGIPSRVLEQAEEIKEIGAGIQVGPNGWRCLRAIGAADRVLPLAVRPNALVMMDSVTGEQVAGVPLGGFEQRFGAPYAVIHRADLHGGLLAACHDSPLVTLETGRKVTDLRDEGDKVVVTTEDGTLYEAPALVGADGLWSTIRSKIIGDGPPRVSGHVTYRAVLRTEDVPERLQRQDMVLWAGPKTHMVHYPLRGGKLYNLVATFISQRYSEGWSSFGDSAELTEAYKDTCDEVRLMLSRIESWRMWVLCDREPIKEWTNGRVTLLGDAAHPTLQYLAQGANMALEDAVCLARSLAENDSVDDGLRAYPMARYLRTGRITLTSRLYGEVFHAEGVRREIRNAFVANANYEGLAWIYDHPV